MSRFATTTSLIGAATLALSLTACGGDDTSAYCDTIEEAEGVLAGNGAADPENPEAVAEFSSTVQEIADAAPDDIQGDWQEVSDLMTTMAEIDTSDPEAMTEQLEGLEELEATGQRISDNVKEECDIELPGL